MRNDRDEMSFRGVSSVMGLDVALALPNVSTVELELLRDDSASFQEVFERHHVDVFRYAIVLTGSWAEADDVAAETFARAWRAWTTGRRPDGPALPWLLVIARNIATDWWRRARRAAASRAPRQGDETQAEVESMIWLRSLIRILPSRQREVVVLRYYRDLSDVQIGQLMGLTESGVRSLAARAIARLREHPEVWR
jgi:RNA polymerase sigma factor (sigma-70 family)